MRAILAKGHGAGDGVGEPDRRLINYYAEVNEGDPARPVKLVTTPGTVDRDSGNVVQGNIRGFGQSDAFASGAILVLDGTTLRTYDPSTGTWGALTGSVSGSDFADFAFTQTELAVLSGGQIYTSSNGTSIALASDADFPASITSIDGIGQRIVMTASDGRWYYTDVLDADSISALNFYTAEASPDRAIAARVLGETLFIFGRKTIEPWFLSGVDQNDPFSRQSYVIPVGVISRDAIAIVDDALFWVSEDRAVRLGDGPRPTVISPPWLVRALQAETASNIRLFGYEAEGHAFLIVNGLTICAAFDLTTQEWHIRRTNGSNSWDWAQIISDGGNQYVAKRTGSAFMQLTRNAATDEQPDDSTLGTDIERFGTAHLPHAEGRSPLGPIIAELSHGVGLANGDGSDPVIGLRLSRDNGQTWTNRRDRDLGVQGAYEQRSKWVRNGRGRRPQTIAELRVVEPVQHSITGLTFGSPS
ncbi:MAG: hypothetical protein AAFQ67_03195 [Pseudomonadota bacterium]